ncbi:hypothetical protein [uncultured Parvimonas sp.]|uniref:hypothetical protein n=1 Tax=uncultured Parvimonas sp. TaxID=747372 RepID=UPI00259ABDBD|nr:hypothetical protein [uncultured Parvimonas sp.]
MIVPCMKIYTVDCTQIKDLDNLCIRATMFASKQVRARFISLTSFISVVMTEKINGRDDV